MIDIDVKSTLDILLIDADYKETKAKEYDDNNDHHKADVLRAEAKGIRNAVKDILKCY